MKTLSILGLLWAFIMLIALGQFLVVLFISIVIACILASGTTAENVNS
jgi:predicted lysophospholipase L1 biosynthesis ABC-type transport system permease subunit